MAEDAPIMQGVGGVNIMARTPGLPALVVLCASCLLAHKFGNAVESGGRRYWSRSGRPVMYGGVVSFTLALVFWGWAMGKVIVDGTADMGVVTFALVMVASVYSCTLALPESELPHIRRAAYAMGTACATVVANYAVVMVGASELTTIFRVYLVAGALVWSALAYVNARALLHHETCVERNLDVATFEDENPDEYLPRDVYPGIRRRVQEFDEED